MIAPLCTRRLEQTDCRSHIFFRTGSGLLDLTSSITYPTLSHIALFGSLAYRASFEENFLAKALEARRDPHAFAEDTVHKSDQVILAQRTELFSRHVDTVVARLSYIPDQVAIVTIYYDATFAFTVLAFGHCLGQTLELRVNVDL